MEAETGSEVVARLRRLIKRSNGFALAFVQCNSRASQERFRGQLEEQLAGMPVLEVALERPVISLLDEIHRRWSSTDAPGAVMVYGLDRSIRDLLDESPVLGRLNHDREMLRRLVSAPLVIWLPTYALDCLARGAPDFWAWRSGVIQCPEQPSPSRLADRPLQKVRGPESLSEADKRAELSRLGQLADLARAQQYPASAGDLLLDAAYLSYLLGEHNSAQASAEAAIALADGVGGSGLRCRALHQIAILEQDRGNLGEARRLYAESLKLKQELGDKRGIAISLHQLAMLEHDQGNLEEAKCLYEESLKLARELGDGSGMVFCLRQMGVLEQDQGHLGEALRLGHDSLKLAQELGDESDIASCLGAIGLLEWEQGDLGEARRLFEESLELAQELGDRSGMAHYLRQMGLLEQVQGNLGEARRFCTESLGLAQELGDKRGIAGSLHQLANLEQDQGNPGEARRLYAESLKLTRELGDKRGIAGSLHQLANLEQDQANLGEALQLYEESLRLLRELGDKRGIATTLHLMAVLERAGGNPGDARRLSEECLKLNRELGDKSGTAISLGHLGRLAKAEGDLVGAARLSTQAWAVFHELGSPLAALALRDLSDLRRQMPETEFSSSIRSTCPEEAETILQALKGG